MTIGLLAFGAACSDAGPELALEITMPASTELTVGELLTLMASASGEVETVSWSSSAPRVATVVAGNVEALRPGTATLTASAAGAVSDDIVLTVVARPNGYTAAEIDYFTEVAFGAEFGDAAPVLRRWRAGSGPLIEIHGSPTVADLETVDTVVAEINRLVPVDIEVVGGSPTVELHFVPQSEFDDILPQAPGGNVGVVWLWWDAQQYLVQSVVLISTGISPALREHIVREELTQMLGLLNDSFLYAQSIFYEDFSTVTEYLPIDRAVIELLYRSELDVGMTTQVAAREARRLTRTGAGPATVAWFEHRAVDRAALRSEAGAWRWTADGPRSGGWARTRGKPGSAGGSSGR